MYRLTTLPNGLRVATLLMPQVESVSVGLWVGVGGRYEAAALSGVSHFIEHLLFKGTRRRTARQISETVENVGGYMNAFTSEETTCFFAKAAHNHLERLTDVLADTYLHSVFESAELEKERGVIRDEILMYHDQPSQYVHELLGQTMWPDHPLGRPLTGSIETVNRLFRADVLAYKRRKYLAPNTVLAIAGRCWHDDAVELATEYFGAMPKARALPRFLSCANNQRSRRFCMRTKQTEQTQLALGAPAYSRHHPARYALRMLSIIFGESVSSRLFQILRERYGLAYSVQSSTGFFADTGAFVVSAGMDHKYLERASRLIMREIRRMAAQPPSQKELERARNYALGQMKLSMESTSSQMMWVGENLLSYGTVPEPAEIERSVQAVTREDVHAVAADLFRDSRWNIAVIGPVKNQQKIESAFA